MCYLIIYNAIFVKVFIIKIRYIIYFSLKLLQFCSWPRTTGHIFKFILHKNIIYIALKFRVFTSRQYMRDIFIFKELLYRFRSIIFNTHQELQFYKAPLEKDQDILQRADLYSSVVP